jgi:trehalose/maltose hydrolase-like predicted phosphorylase
VATNDEPARSFDKVLRPSADPTWLICEPRYDPIRESGVESRLTVSNGFLGIRAARAISRGPMWVSWSHTLSWASWPRTYVAGLFDTPNTQPPVPALVPGPDWLRLRLFLDGQPVLLRSGKLLEHRRTLDMRRGLLSSDWRHSDGAGRIAHIRSIRFVSLAERAMGLQLLELSVDQRVEVTLEALTEEVGPALEIVQMRPDLAVWRTAESGKGLALASAAELQVDGQVLQPIVRGDLKWRWVWPSEPGRPAHLWRVVAFARSDSGVDGLDGRVRGALQHALGVSWRGVLHAHENAWAKQWTASDIRVEGDEEAQKALRFAVYHLIGATNPEDERVSIGARALTGESYLGHVFWDTEIYLLPFYIATWPEAARALLMYRYHTLPGARAKAARMGYRGAMYAWESADTGEETTPEQIIDFNGRPVEVLCGKQEQHISADIAYAVWQYLRVTGDDDFLVTAGAEILLETARFWASRAEADADGSFHIRGVIGPDEYHEHIDDNAFTNVMAQWNIQRGLETAMRLRELWPDRWEALSTRLGLTDQEMQHWRDVANHLVIRFDPQNGLFEQFSGYFNLEDIDLAQYEGRAVPMDVVLGRERTQRSQVLKQADVVALFAMLPDAYDEQVQAANFRYYEPRCGHGSSLSRGLHALVAARLGDVDLAKRYFRETAAIDLADTTTGSAGGVHIAALGGLWQAAVFGFAGLSWRDDGIALEPHLPAEWEAMEFRICWRKRWVHVRIDGASRLLVATLETGEPMAISVCGERHELQSGQSRQVTWHERPADSAQLGSRTCGADDPPGAAAAPDQ